MATIQKTLADTAGFIPQAWANEALSVLRNQIVLAKLCARDSDFTEGAWKGKQLTIPYPGTFAAQQKVPGSVATTQTPSNGSAAVVSLTQHETVDFILEDLAFTESTGMGMMNAYGEAAGTALAEQVESDVLAQFTGFTGNPAAGYVGTPGTPVSATAIRAAVAQLDTNKAPQSNRFMIVTPADKQALLGDSTLATYFAYSQAKAISNGAIGSLYGLDVFMSQLTPSQAAGAGWQQSITTGGTVSGGTFTLTYSGQTTAAIAWNATAATVQAAIAALSNVGTGNVACAGGPLPGSAVTVNFVNALANNVTTMTVTSSLTGTSPTIAVANTAQAINHNLAMHKNAVLLATRPLMTVATAGVEVAYANDPVSGLSLRVQMQVKPEYRGVYVAYDILYGMTPLRPNQGVVVAS